MLLQDVNPWYLQQFISQYTSSFCTKIICQHTVSKSSEFTFFSFQLKMVKVRY